jgi:endonuclease YncB( thermonuclease family)
VRVSKHWKPGRQTVALQGPARPSRIRRDPLLAKPIEKKAEPLSQEREIWLGVTGVVLFAFAIAVATAGFSVITGKDGGAAAAPVNADRFGDCTGGPNCVIDGDTVRIRGETVDIAGMRAPQLATARCDAEEQRGVKAVERLTQLLNSGKVTTGADVREADGQVRTTVLVDGRDVGAAMVGAELAQEPRSNPPSWCD